VLTDVTMTDEDLTLSGRVFHCKSIVLPGGTISFSYASEIPLDMRARSLTLARGDGTESDPVFRDAEYRMTTDVVGFTRAGQSWGKTLDEVEIPKPAWEPK
jgi:hypothetical protein